MTVTTAARTISGIPGNAGPTFLRVLHAEWIRFASVRSSWIMVGAMLATMVAVGGVIAAAASAGQADVDRGELLDAVRSAVTAGVLLVAPLAGAIGVATTAGEHQTGTVAVTFTAVPRRTPVLLAKAAVAAAVAAAGGVLGSVLAWGLGWLATVRSDLVVPFTDRQILAAVGGSVGYLACVGVMGVALGAIARSAVLGTLLLVGLLFGLPLAGLGLPTDVAAPWQSVLPSVAGRDLVVVHPLGHGPALARDILVLVGWCALVWAFGHLRLVRRDV